MVGWRGCPPPILWDTHTMGNSAVQSCKLQDYKEMIASILKKKNLESFLFLLELFNSKFQSSILNFGVTSKFIKFKSSTKNRDSLFLDWAYLFSKKGAKFLKKYCQKFIANTFTSLFLSYQQYHKQQVIYRKLQINNKRN